LARGRHEVDGGSLRHHARRRHANVSVNEAANAPRGCRWRYAFNGGTSGNVCDLHHGTSNYVIVDAVKFVRPVIGL